MGAWDDAIRSNEQSIIGATKADRRALNERSAGIRDGMGDGRAVTDSPRIAHRFGDRLPMALVENGCADDVDDSHPHSQTEVWDCESALGTIERDETFAYAVKRRDAVMTEWERVTAAEWMAERAAELPPKRRYGPAVIPTAKHVPSALRPAENTYVCGHMLCNEGKCERWGTTDHA